MKHFFQACEVICETGDCRQQEFRDRSGNCVLCQQCGPGMELSKVDVGYVVKLSIGVFKMCSFQLNSFC